MRAQRIPCDELIDICQGRCCKLRVERLDDDCDRNLIRWDSQTGRWAMQRDDGYCVHNDVTSQRCGIYDQRPNRCRSFDCRDDPRIWVNFDARIPALFMAITINKGSTSVPSICLSIDQLC